MPYIGQSPTQSAFVTDQFSGNGSTTAFTMSVAPANTASALVVVSGVMQDPSTYSVSGTTLTFTGAPPSGTGNISVRYLGIPASGITTTAYRTVTEFTATASQTTFTPPSYTVGYIDVYRNGVRLGASDYTATNGTTVVLTTGATAGDLITTESFYVSSVLNAIPATAGAVNSTYIAAGAVGTTQLASGAVLAANMGSGATWAPSGTVVQVVTQNDGGSSTTSTTRVNLNASSVSITPKSTSSKLIIEVGFAAFIGYAGAGTNSTGTFDISEGSTTVSYASQLLSVASGFGTNVQVNAPAYLIATVTNSALTARSFTIYGKTSASAATASATGMTWKITEVIV